MKKNAGLILKVSMIFVTTFLFIPDLFGSKEPDIQDVSFTRTSKELLVQFTVGNCFNDNMKEAILSGIPTTFLFFINLYENRSFWFDKKIAARKIMHTVKYDSLKEEFHITFKGKGSKTTVVKDFLTARKMMEEAKDIAIVPIKRIKKEGDYYIGIKAKLDSTNLPFYLDYVLFFVSSWDFETDWHTKDIDFREKK